MAKYRRFVEGWDVGDGQHALVWIIFLGLLLPIAGRLSMARAQPHLLNELQYKARMRRSTRLAISDGDDFEAGWRGDL